MKRFLFFMALLCIWCISFNSVKAVSNAELQDTCLLYTSRCV